MIPDEVQEKIDFLNTYTNNPKLQSFDAVHMYPNGLAYPDGYFDSMWFNLVGYNFTTKEKRTIEYRDGLHMNDYVEVDIVRIYADGSTFIRFKNKVSFGIYQCVEVYNENLSSRH